MNKCVFIFFLFLNLILGAQKSELKFGWKFRKVGDAKWIYARVPGTVASNLIHEKYFEDYNEKDNAAKFEKLENDDWEYVCDFDVTPEQISKSHAEIIFEGLDTYATVYLNDNLIINADNMFRTWQAEIKSKIKVGTNQLKVIFTSPLKIAEKEKQKLKYNLPESERVFARKAQFQYGWDFSPRLVSAGIWKPVYLNFWNEFNLKNIGYEIKNMDTSRVAVQFLMHYQADSTELIKVEIVDIDKNQRLPHPPVQRIKSGEFDMRLMCTINHPEFWWCNGQGNPKIYHLKITVTKKNQILSESIVNIGLRNINLLKERDEKGESFCFELNGRKIFIKGANYVPQNVLLTEVKPEAEKNIILKAKESGMNMLRIWGGGIYPSDNFLNLCDENGILIWQDFMFACAMYPGDKHFLENVFAETDEQITRIKKHPCLALWCGNNEIDEGWNNWGWQKQFKYSHSDSLEIIWNYKLLFEDSLPKIIKRLHPSGNYISSSPQIGWGHPESLQRGDSHYWGVWWGMEPFDSYDKKVGRFMSEYGFQSLPDYSTQKKIAPDGELNLQNSIIKFHQKHKTGFETINSYLLHDYKMPENFRDYVYESQLVQRDGMNRAIAAHRAAKPYCMGTLFWQLNDSWRGFSWSALDFDLKPKAFFYDLKKSYATVFMQIANENKKIKINCVSDSVKGFDAQLEVELMDLNGKKLMSQKKEITLTAEKNTVTEWNEKDFHIHDSASSYLQCRLIRMGKTICESKHFLCKAKNLKLKSCNIQITSLEGNKIKVRSDEFAKDVYLYCEKSDFSFSENYFDLSPGEEKIIDCSGLGDNISGIKYITLNNIIFKP